MDGGKVTALRATTAQPVTAGFMCAKMGRYPDRVNGSDRILTPLIRRGPKGSGSFEPASWEAALDEIVARFRDVIGRHGGEAILPYHYDGSNGVFAHDLIDEALWRRLGASRLGRTLCAAPATEAATAIYGKMAGVAFPDYVHARAIVVWGANPGESNIHLVPHLNEARKRGARLIVIDPRRSQIAHHADLHLAVWPGSDLAVALWLIGEVDRRGKVATAFLEAHTRNAPLLLEEASRVTIERRRRESPRRAAGSRAARRPLPRGRPRADPDRMGTRAQPQRRRRDGRDPRDPGDRGKVRRARRRLHALELGRVPHEER